MNMKRLLVRYGFKQTEAPSSHASQLLEATMQKLDTLSIVTGEVEESHWLDALERASHQVSQLGREGLVDPQITELPLADIDLYVRGIVRWMNELAIHTAHCCDGHGKRTPNVALLHPPTKRQRSLLTMSLPEGLKLRWRGRQMLMEYDGKGAPRGLLLNYAERLHDLVQHPEQFLRYEARNFKDRYLMELLNTPGESGREAQIRRVVLRRLRPLADELYTDLCGNVLATRHYGDGPTVLLSAHMDLYQELDSDRKILEEGNWLRSTSGILGADDRAGIAIALHLWEHIRQTNFRGTLKLAFTVKEEIGLIGARNIDSRFMHDVDAAIVIDRKGNRDIVTSCRGVLPFCHPSYGHLFEEAGKLAGMEDWKMTEGGSSDASVFSKVFGINTVNLSAGYQHEHTSNEALDYMAAYETAKLIESVLHEQLIEKWINQMSKRYVKILPD